MGQATIRRLGILPGDAAEDYRLSRLFYAALRESQSAYEQAFFDFAGGAIASRLQASPAANDYTSGAWKAAIAAIRDRAAAGGRQDRGIAPYPGEKPLTMLIDDVEAIWQAIDSHDDWCPFERKIGEIRAFGQANRQNGND